MTTTPNLSTSLLPHPTPVLSSLHPTTPTHLPLPTKPIPSLSLSFSPPPSPTSPKQITHFLKHNPNLPTSLHFFHSLRSDPSYTPNPIHYNVLLRRLGLARLWDSLRLLWQLMASDCLVPTNTTYSTLVHVYSSSARLPTLALRWFPHMRSRGVVPDEVTVATVLKVLKDASQFDVADRFYKSWLDGGVEYDEIEISERDDGKDGGDLSKHFILSELFKYGARPKGGGRLEQCGPRRPRMAATYNAVIDLYGKAGWIRNASEAFREMLAVGVAPDATTFNTMMNICGRCGNKEEAEVLLRVMEERRVSPDVKTFNVFMSLAASAGDVDGVVGYFKRIESSKLRPDVVSYRILIQVLCGRNMVGEFEDLVGEMERSGVLVDEQSIPVVTKMYVEMGLLEKGKMFLEKHCFGRGIPSSVYAAILDAYAEKGLSVEAEEIFHEKRKPDCRKGVAEYNVMIKAYGKARLYEKAVSLFEGMTETGTWPDECTYNSVIQMLSLADFPERASDLIPKMQHAGFRPRCETFSAVMASKSRAGMISDMMEVYKEMKRLGVEPNEYIYGSLINAFAESGNVEEAVRLFRKMQDSNLPINQIVITSMIKAYRKVGRWQKAQELYGKLKASECGPDIIASNSMIDLYAELGMITEAQLIFDDLRRIGRADGISYATMMHLYRSMGMLDEAIEVAQEMQQAGVLTDCLSFNIVMASYAANAQLRECGDLLEQMQLRRILPDSTTFKVMLTVLKKAGIPPEAVAQLEASYVDGKPYARQAIITVMFSVVGMHELAEKSCETFVGAGISLDSSAYNAAIFAFGSAGKIDKALNLLMRMQDEGLEPDVVTFINLVGCYGKAGLVEGVRRIYGKLKCGDIEPNESLFRAIINAYTDAGKADLAEQVDQEMRFNLQLHDESEAEDESE